jgi:hypothetical protein
LCKRCYDQRKSDGKIEKLIDCREVARL